MQTQHSMTAADLEAALVKMAEIIVGYPQYVCLFERVERELAKALHDDGVLGRARRIAETGEVDREHLLKVYSRGAL